MTTVEAVRQLRSDPQYASVIHDSYLEEDVVAAAERFRQSVEFSEVCVLLHGHLHGCTILDLGAGTGIASYAMAKAGAGMVYALEPDPGEVGRDAINRLSVDLAITTLDATGERIPLDDKSVDAIYARQVLHHTRDLNGVLRECARVLKPGGLILICREHVADNEAQLNQFLADHPIHQLAGGEHAYPLASYQKAIMESGLQLLRTLGPWDSVINAFPAVKSRAQMESMPEVVLRERFGATARLLRIIPGMRHLVWRRMKSYPSPGRLYSFLAVSPSLPPGQSPSN